MGHELARLLIDVVSVDQDFADVGLEVVADRADDQTAFLIDEERTGLAFGRTLDRAPGPDPDYDPLAPSPATSSAPYRVYNIGNNRPVQLLRYIEVLEDCLGRKATMNLLPLQPGDVPDTYADVSALTRDTGYQPTTPVEVGVKKFVEWYRGFYGV
mgnify:CR=1 FL=1